METITQPKPYTPPALVTLTPDSWEARLVAYLRRQHLTGKPVTVILRLGDCPVNWLRGIPDGR